MMCPNTNTVIEDTHDESSWFPMGAWGTNYANISDQMIAIRDAFNGLLTDSKADLTPEAKNGRCTTIITAAKGSRERLEQWNISAETAIRANVAERQEVAEAEIARKRQSKPSKT